MRCAASILAVLLGAGLSSAAAPPQAPAAVPVYLAVKVDTPEGDPLGGVRVNVYQSNPRLSGLVSVPPDVQGDTDQTGLARLIVLAAPDVPLTFTIEVSREDRTTQRRTMSLGTTYPTRLPLQRFTLRTKAGTGDERFVTLAVTVRGTAGPIEGATVRASAYAGRTYEGTTGPSGVATIQVPLIFNNSLFYLDASKSGYKRGARTTVTLLEEQIGSTVGGGVLTLESTSATAPEEPAQTDDRTADPAQPPPPLYAIGLGVDGLEARVLAWFADYQNRTATANREAFIAAALAARTRANALVHEIEGMRTAFGQGMVPGAPGSFCRDARLRQDEIRSLQQEIAQKAEAMNEALDAGRSAAQACSTPADAERVRREYRKALQALSEIDTRTTRARSARQELITFAEASDNAKQLLSEIRTKVAEVEAQSDAAERNAAAAAQYSAEAANRARSLPPRQQSLKTLAATLRTQYTSATAALSGAEMTGEPLALGKRLDRIEDMLSVPDNDMSSGQTPAAPLEVTQAVVATRSAKATAARLLQQYTAAPCSIDTMDAALDDIDATHSAATFVAGRGAELQRRADECAPGTASPSGVETLPEDRTPVPDTSAPDRRRSSWADALGAILGAVGRAVNDVKAGSGRGPGPPGPAPAAPPAPPPAAATPSYGDLTGTWEMSASVSNPGPDGDCTLVMTLTLQPAGNNVWHGRESWQHPCRNPLRGAESHEWRLSLTAAGVVSGTVTNADGTFVPVRGAFDGTRMSFPSGNSAVVFVRR